MTDSSYGVINEQGILYGETPIMEFEEVKDKENNNENRTNDNRNSNNDY